MEAIGQPTQVKVVTLWHKDPVHTSPIAITMSLCNYLFAISPPYPITAFQITGDKWWLVFVLNLCVPAAYHSAWHAVATQ